MADTDEMNWFQFTADIQIAEPELDEKTDRYGGGMFHSEALTQEMLKELFDKEGHFLFRVDASPDELWLRVCRSNAEDESPDEDLVFINVSRRNAERIREALDAALKMTEARGRAGT